MASPGLVHPSLRGSRARPRPGRRQTRPVYAPRLAGCLSHTTLPSTLDLAAPAPSPPPAPRSISSSPLRSEHPAIGLLFLSLQLLPPDSRAVVRSGYSTQRRSQCNSTTSGSFPISDFLHMP